MDLSSAAPSPTATLFFTLPGSEDRVQTDTGKDMCAVVFGSDTAEFKKANLAKLRIHTSVAEGRMKSDGKDAKLTQEDVDKMGEAEDEFISAIIKSVLFQIDGKESTSVEKFVKDERLAFFKAKTLSFANNVTNFLQAQPTS